MKLQDYLDQFTRPSELVEAAPDGALRCLACAHTCRISPGQRGICKLRFNREGKLQVPWGYVSSLQVDRSQQGVVERLLVQVRVLGLVV